MLRKLGGLVKELGAINAVAYLMDKVLSTFGPRYQLVKYYFVAQPVPPATDGGSKRTSALTVRRLRPDEPCFPAFQLDDKVLAFRFGQNAVCFGIFKDAEPAGCLWLCENGYLEDEVRCRYVPLPADETVWDFGVYIDPKYRLGRAFTQLWGATFDWLREHNRKWSLSRISGFNRMSLVSQKRLGATVLGSATFLCLGPIQVTFATVRPYIHFSASTSSMPVVHLCAPKE